MRPWIALPLLLIVTPAAHASVLAVTHIEDHTQRFSGERLEQWRTYLAARIAASKRYRLAASRDVRELLAKIKHASFSGAFDERSRVELGRELAADKVLEVQLFNAGPSCALVAALYDLEHAVADEAYSRTADCDETQLQRSIDELAGTITGEELEEPSTPWKISADLLSLGMGYGGTIGGATGPILAAELFTIRFGPLHATLFDAGTTVFASKGELFDQVDHAMSYAGSTIGAALVFGPSDQHELRIGAGPALYRASAEADFFTGLKINADETDGLTPALIADARYIFHMTQNFELELAFGGGIRAIVPAARFSGDPTLVMMKLFLNFGSP